jgi:tRNA dimethylallyltransferase
MTTTTNVTELVRSVAAAFADAPPLLVIGGATATGKTALAIQLAQALEAERGIQCEILSADSRQRYAALPIGTAQPTADELTAVPHHFVGDLALEATKNFESAGDWANQARALTERLHAEGKGVIVVGGSGLYIKAFLYGLDLMPEVEDGLREAITLELAEKGLAWLQAEIRELDPVYANSANPSDWQNPQRLSRALEIIRSTGQPYSNFRLKDGISPELIPSWKSFLGWTLDLPREVLHERIAQRATAMLANGLIEEARAAMPFRDMQALNTVGYPEIFGYLEGKYDLPRALELLTLHTRQLAKRQKTFFRNQLGALGELRG